MNQVLKPSSQEPQNTSGTPVASEAMDLEYMQYLGLLTAGKGTAQHNQMSVRPQVGGLWLKVITFLQTDVEVETGFLKTIYMGPL